MRIKQMTDKEQIIIDGCNVSGCENYRPKDRFTCYPYICNCHQKPDCHYKQLTRKTQECERLKIYIESNEQQVKEVETLVMDNDRLINELDQLKRKKQECQKYEQAFNEIAAHYQKVMKNITTYDNSYDASISIEALHNISDIINKVKDEN